MDSTRASLLVLWSRCPACGGTAGFRFERHRVVGACFEGKGCWWVGVRPAPEGRLA